MARQRTLLGWMLAALITLSVGQLLSLTEHSRQETAEAVLYTGRSAWVRGVVIRREIPVTADPSVDWAPVIRDGQRASAGQTLLRQESGPENEVRARRLRLRQVGENAAALPVTVRRAAIHETIALGSGAAGTARMAAAESLTGLLLGEGDMSAPDGLETAPAQQAGALRTVASPESGVFAAAADGLETVLTPEDPWYSWPLPAKPLPRGTVGRLVIGDTWYFRTQLPFSVEPEEQVTGFLPWCDRALTLRVEEVRKAGVLLSCSQMLSEVAPVRQIEMKILENCKTGLEIPAGGVYTVERETGVWRLEGEAARFVPVTVLRQLGETVVVDMDSDTGPLWPGDEILIDGQ